MKHPNHLVQPRLQETSHRILNVFWHQLLGIREQRHPIATLVDFKDRAGELDARLMASLLHYSCPVSKAEAFTYVGIPFPGAVQYWYRAPSEKTLFLAALFVMLDMLLGV